MNRKTLPASLGLLLLAGGLVFAGGQQEGTAEMEAEEGPIPIEAFFWFDPPDTDDLIFNEIETKFNVEFAYSSSDSYQESLRLRIASGDYPDWFQSRSYPDYSAMYEDGLTHNISDYLTEYALPDLRDYLNREDIQILKEEDGWHMVPRWVGAMTHSIYVRQDWIDEIGIDMPPMDEPQTMDEFRDMLAAFVDADPEGTNPTGLVAFSDWWYRHLMLPFTGVYGWGTYNGETIHQYAHPGYRDAFEYFADLYADGLIDPEIATTNRTVAEEKFHTGRAAALLGHSATNYRKANLLQPMRERFPDAEIRLLLWPAGPHGPALKGRIPFFGSTMMSPDIEEAKLVRILEIMDYILSPEGRDLMWYGLEGIHHEVQDGEKVKNDDVVNEQWGAHQHTLGIWVNGGLKQRAVEVDPQTQLAFAFNAEHQLVNPLQLWTGQMKDELRSQVDEVHQRWWFEFVLGDRDVDEDWDVYVQELNRAGLEELTELASEQLGN
jgi:ABC-type glycerol-3-phosphate transport system substrate-binding protein